MKLVSSIAYLLLAMLLTTTAFASSLTIYEKPDTASKAVASIDSDKQLIPIIYTDKKDWIKIANPKNGDVGWIEINKFKGPLVSTQVDGSSVKQEIIINKEDKNKKPIFYRIVQYSGSDQLDSKEAEKIIKDMEQHRKKMRQDFQKMQEDMQKSMQEMFKEFNQIL